MDKDLKIWHSTFKRTYEEMDDFYEDFVLRHILRPYQNMIMDEDRLTSVKEHYRNIPFLGRDHQDWESCVFTRLAKIYRAIDEGKWAIITSHGSCSGVDYIGSRSDVLWAAPVGEVLKYILVRDAAQFTNYNRFGRTISFDAAHDLGTFERQQVDGTPMSPIVFDNSVTLKVHILDTDDVLGVEVDDVPVSYSVQTLEGTRYVLFDASLEATRHVVITLAQPAPTIEEITDNSPVELGSTAEVVATVTIDEGTIQAVTLQVLSPEAAEYPMTLVGGTTDNYAASFVPGQLGEYSYQVLASNEEDNTAQSLLQTW